MYSDPFCFALYFLLHFKYAGNEKNFKLLMEDFKELICVFFFNLRQCALKSQNQRI